MKNVKFKLNGQVIEGYILSQDSDQSARVWVIEKNNPDQDHMIQVSDIVK